MIQPTGNSLLKTASNTIPANEVKKSQKDTAAEKEQAAKQDKAVDTVDKAPSKSDAGIYTKPDTKLSLDQLRSMNEQRISQFNAMLQGMIGKQIGQVNKAAFKGINITPAQSAEAQKSISEGGEWSPDAVSGRILDMAKALSGGDSSKFDLLKKAVMKGFGEAEKQWGDDLPDITNQTYDKVMKGFDDWKKELDGTTTTE